MVDESASVEMLKSKNDIQHGVGIVKAVAPATSSVMPFLVSPQDVSQPGGTREIVMHCLMYGTSLYSELNEYRQYRADNTHKVAYSSGALS